MTILGEVKYLVRLSLLSYMDIFGYLMIHNGQGIFGEVSLANKHPIFGELPLDVGIFGYLVAYMYHSEVSFGEVYLHFGQESSVAFLARFYP